MGHSDWIDMHLTNALEGPLAIQNAQLVHGKFYADDDKDDEIGAEQVEDIVIPESGSGDVYSCGRQGAPVGTQGSFDLVDQDNSQKICTINWSSPYSGSGYLSASEVNRNYTVSIPAVRGNGPVGFVDISVAEL